MSEDASNQARIATHRLIRLFEGLGWNLKGKPDVNTSLEGIDDEDRRHGYGLDAFMTYDDPHGPHIQGNIVESKAWQWRSIKPSTVESFFETLLEKVEKAPETNDFDSRINFGSEANIVNTGILAIWSMDAENYDHEMFQDYVSRLDIPRKLELSKILILGNQELRRLATLENAYRNLKKEHGDDLKIAYPDISDANGSRADLINLNYIVSDYVYASIEGDENIGIVFYFDDLSYEALSFMHTSMRRYQRISGYERIHIYTPNRGYQSENAEEEFLNEYNTEKTNFKFMTMENIADLGHLDNR